MTQKFYTSFEMEWDHILLSYYEDGSKYNKKIKLKPYLFIPSALDDAEYESFDGKPLSKIDFDSVKQTRDFVRSYEGVPNFKIYGLPLFHYVYIYDNFKNSVFDRSILKVLNYDIEVDTTDGYPTHNMADKEINVLTMKLFGSKDIYVLGLHPYQTKEQELLDLIDKGYRIFYKHCKDEREILEKFYTIWKKLEPDVVTGWNIKRFDVPYIIKRASYLFDQEFVNSLSPFGKIKSDVVNIFNKEYDVYDIVGVPTLDYMDVYKKFSMNVEESYSLNYLSNKILHATKLDYSEFGTLGRLQVGNWNKYTDYNIIDVIRVEQIDEAVRYMDIAFEIAYETQTNYIDSLATIRVWDIMIHNFLMDQKRVVPFSVNNRKERSIAGGHVKDPQIGKHDWVMSFDFRSLYPSLCMSFNISPDTYLGTMKSIVGTSSVDKILEGQLDQHRQTMVDKDVTVTGCGTVFSRNRQGFIPAIMERLFSKRIDHANEETDRSKKLEQIRNEINRRGLTV